MSWDLYATPILFQLLVVFFLGFLFSFFSYGFFIYIFALIIFELFYILKSGDRSYQYIFSRVGIVFTAILGFIFGRAVFGDPYIVRNSYFTDEEIPVNIIYIDDTFKEIKYERLLNAKLAEELLRLDKQY